MAKKTYTIVIKVNGKTVESMPGAQITFGGMEREPLTINGQAGRHYIEKPAAGRVSFKIAHGADTDIDEVREWTDVTLVAVCDSGITYQMAGAYTTNAIALSDGDGGLAVEMAGPPFEVV